MLKFLHFHFGIFLHFDGNIYTVKREFYFQLDGYDNKNNFIDILIICGEEANPQRIICIENKIYSSEGFKQTERYQLGIEKIYHSENIKKDYIFITKNNSFVNLTSGKFKHVKYMDVAKGLKEDVELYSLRFAKDFCEYYYEREYIKFHNIESENPEIFGKEDDFINYFVWKANSSDKFENLYVKDGKSSKSDARFVQITKQSWNKKINIFEGEVTLHLEGTCNNFRLHFETYPYIPYSKLKEISGKDFIKYGAKGYYSHSMKRIVINEGMSELQTLKTLVHESMHRFLHDKDGCLISEIEEIRPSREQRETEAEVGAYVVLKHFNFDTSDYSFNYVCSWSNGKDMKVLKESLDTISKASDWMIDGIEEQLQLMAEEKQGITMVM